MIGLALLRSKMLDNIKSINQYVDVNNIICEMD